MLRHVKTGLNWIAGVEAMPGTGILGEGWYVNNDRVITCCAQPHAWEQILFYLTSLEAYGGTPFNRTRERSRVIGRARPPSGQHSAPRRRAPG